MQRISFKPELVIFLLLVALRTTLPFDEDQKIFFAAAKFASFRSESFPLNVIEQWELKPWPSRMFYYGLYQVTDIFTKDFLTSIILSQVMFTVLILSISWRLARSFGSLSLFYIISSLLLFVSPEIFLQPEHVACAFSLLIIVASKENWRYSLQTILLTSFFVTSLKLVTVIYLLFPIVYLLIESRSKINRSIIFLITGSIFGIFATINETLLSFRIQQSQVSSYSAPSAEILMPNIGHLKFAIVNMPLAAVTPILLAMIFHILPKRHFILAISALTLCFVALTLQRAFAYHFTFLISFQILCAILLMRSEYRGSFRLKNMVALSLLVPIMIFSQFWAPSKFQISLHGGNLQVESRAKQGGLIMESLKKFRSEEIASRRIARFVGNKEILFLTDGLINYYLVNRSYCEEFYPISLQRFIDTILLISDLDKKNSLVEGTFNCIQSYKGEFIIAQPHWLTVDKLSQAGILANYQKIGQAEFGDRYLEIWRRF